MSLKLIICYYSTSPSVPIGSNLSNCNNQLSRNSKFCFFFLFFFSPFIKKEFKVAKAMQALLTTIFVEAFISFLVRSLLVWCSCCHRNRPEGALLQITMVFPILRQSFHASVQQVPFPWGQKGKGINQSLTLPSIKFSLPEFMICFCL